jgi:hypothetical protein
VRAPRRRRERCRFGDDHGLLLVGLEAGGEQPPAQLRPVVGVVLPLDVPRQLAHSRHQRLDVAVRRPPEDGAPAVADEEPLGSGLAAHLLVEEREDRFRVHGGKL